MIDHLAGKLKKKVEGRKFDGSERDFNIRNII